MEIISGRELSSEIRDELKRENELEGIRPVLAIINVGDDKANLLYIGLKQNAMSHIGGQAEVAMLDWKVSRHELLAKIEAFNHHPGVHGILLQLPLSPELEPHREELLAAIRPDKDVDGFTPFNRGALLGGRPYYVSCVAQAAMEMIERCRGEVKGCTALLAGDSFDLIQPLTLLLMRAGAEVTVLPEWREDIVTDCQVVVVEKGGWNCVRPEQLSVDCLLIDNGYYFDPTGKLSGNVDKDTMLGSELRGWLVPNPGGLGPLLVTRLVRSVHQAARSIKD
ncbi:MAG: tetrahydrofolate dehydrogenase/cyclohydrolase catalytic domain-containing protein [Syntrophomonadaceae bacterium]|nr:tetrahydrofolate dehydrogenase/cyclohydrolase catalytic domain-containing protein [Syntrophomonadaceae bacterium]